MTTDESGINNVFSVAVHVMAGLILPHLFVTVCYLVLHYNVFAVKFCLVSLSGLSGNGPDYWSLEAKLMQLIMLA
jgi:hypothetical protein